MLTRRGSLHRCRGDEPLVARAVARYARGVSPRSQRLVVRAFVLAMIGCIVVATWALRVTMQPSEPGFYAVLVYLPIVGVPGWLAWHAPRRPEFLVLWSAIGWIATVVVEAAIHEQAFFEQPWIARPMMIALAGILVGAPVLAAMVMPQRRGRESRRLATRLRGLVKIVAACELVRLVAFYAIWPDPGAWKYAIVCATAALAVAAPVWLDPRRLWAAVWWLGACVPAAMTGILLYDIRSDVQLVPFVLGYSAIYFGIPIVCLVTPPTTDEPSLPEARVV
jgi:hypothetical protein